MSLTYIPVVGTFTYRDEDGTPAAGGKIHFIPVTPAVVDGETITLPKKLIVTLNDDGEVPAGFALPTVGDGVFYKVSEKFSGNRPDFTIEVLVDDVEVDLATITPAVPTEDMAAYATLAALNALDARVENLEDASGFSGSYNDLTDKPTLFSGAYADLSGKPTLGTAAAAATTDFATAAQGAKADTAVQPAGLTAAAVASAVQTESTNARTYAAADAGKYTRHTYSGAKTATFNTAASLPTSSEYHVVNRSASGNLTLDGTMTLNPQKNGTLVLEPGDSVTVKVVSGSEADVIGSTVAA